MSSELTDTQKLHAISEATNDDGTINVQLHDFNRTEADDRVKVEFITPDGQIEGEVMPWPKADTDEYKFVRIFNQTGYGIIAAEEACEQGVEVKAERDRSWRLHAPVDYSTVDIANSKISKLKEMHFESTDDWNFWGMLIAFPLLMMLTIVAYPVSDNIRDVAIGYSMALWHTIIWAIAIAAIVMFI